eukprot:10760857-Ditylum_brightwellii.AAC.1
MGHCKDVMLACNYLFLLFWVCCTQHADILPITGKVFPFFQYIAELLHSIKCLKPDLPALDICCFPVKD